MKPSRIFDVIYNQQSAYPIENAIGHKVNGQWTFLSTQEFINQVQKTAGGLLKLGLKKGDKIAVVSYTNRPEWAVVDFAAQHVGIVTIPLYPTISPGEYEYIMNDAEVSFAFVGKADLYDKVLEAKAKVPTLKEIYTFDQTENRLFWEDIWTTEKADAVSELMDQVASDDLATIIYTSGTTGKPKGVMLSHLNIVHIINATEDLLLSAPGEPVLSFLPMCHIFERTVYLAYINKGCSIYFTGTDNLGGDNGDLKTVKPSFFTTVPRLLEKVYEAIYNRGLQLTGMKRRLFFWALSLTDDFEYDQSYTGWRGVQQRMADRLIFSKWREALGGNVRGIVTGAAPCPTNVLKVFSAAGIPIYEGYGLTEAAPTITVNKPEVGGSKIGTVGTIIEGVRVKIDDTEGDYQPGEGEILANGPNIMIGYYNKPEENKKVFKMIDGERWLRTGDVGKLIKQTKGDGYFLKITDRKKELLKTSGGKYVAPAPIENKLREDFLVEQVMVVGDKRKFVSALIVPAEEALKDFCEQQDIPWTNLELMVKEQVILDKFQAIIDQYNPLFSHIEQVKQFKLITTPWTPTKSDGTEAELTPTMKLKRRVILSKYQQDIDSIYGG